MEEMLQLEGKIMYILFHSEETFYTVAKFRLIDEKEKVITITGNMPEVQTNVHYKITGSYTEHPKYGLQFKVATYEKPLPNEINGIIQYLSGVKFPGIGAKTAEKVAMALGNDCLKMIKEDPEVLRTIPGLSEKHITVLQEGMKEDDEGLEQLVSFLNINGIGMRNLIRLNKAYGKKAMEKIRENPYRVIEECDGFGFETADKIAKSLGYADDDHKRLYAYLIDLVMKLCMANGDSFVRLEALEERFLEKTKGIDCDFGELLDEALAKQSLYQEDNHIYAVSQYESETYIADFLKNFPYVHSEKPEKEIMEKYLHSMELDYQIEYDPQQKLAIESFMMEPFMILTGGPGTGKTTVIKAMFHLYQLMNPSSKVICVAPTGRAAKRMAELSESFATTIHSLCMWNLETNTFGKNEDDPLETDVLIIDEFSMVDSYLFANLLKACRNVRKIIVIGDEDQLPSVGPGCVLRDLIASAKFPLVRLNLVHRQKSGSDVISLAHDINCECVDFSKYTGDVAFFPCSSTDIRKNVLAIVQNAVDKGYDLNDIQVLSPMYNGSAGIDVMNNALQECFNPSDFTKREVRFGYMTFREGDKILQLKNQPEDEVYNGDIGVLVEILEADETEDKKRTLIVDFQGTYVEYKPENWVNLTLAYCISVHKSQGSEYPIVILPITRQHHIMLQRKLIYTAVTRASRSLVLLGEENAFIRGIETLERHPRETGLCERLKDTYDDDDNPFDVL